MQKTMHVGSILMGAVSAILVMALAAVPSFADEVYATQADGNGGFFWIRDENLPWWWWLPYLVIGVVVGALIVLLINYLLRRKDKKDDEEEQNAINGDDFDASFSESGVQAGQQPSQQQFPSSERPA